MRIVPVMLHCIKGLRETVTKHFTLLLSRHKKNPYHRSSRGLVLGYYEVLLVALDIMLVISINLHCLRELVLSLIGFKMPILLLH